MHTVRPGQIGFTTVQDGPKSRGSNKTISDILSSSGQVSFVVRNSSVKVLSQLGDAVLGLAIHADLSKMLER